MAYPYTTVEYEEGYEVVVSAQPRRIVLTCEHASGRLPEPWQWSEADRQLQQTHWCYDIGAAELVRGMIARLGGVGVLARFTRLLIDANRELDSSTLIRPIAEGHEVDFNRNVSQTDRDTRISGYYQPYHEALNRWVTQTPKVPLVAIHTFTDCFEGKMRDMEIGILFDRDEELAVLVCESLRRAGFATALNAPYSGVQGMMYSVSRHADQHARKALEIEVRQDLSGDPEQQERLVEALSAAIDCCT
jgi:predicted N-formylglutamate amidohydrolase